jgi:hypothetical protein
MKVSRRLALLAATVLLGGVTAQAQVIKAAGGVDDEAPLIEATVRPGEIVGNEQVMRTFIKCGTNEFLFVLPPDLRTESTNPDGLVLAGPGGRYFLKFRITGARPWDSEAAQAQARKETALAQYDSAGNIEDFTMTVAGRTAQGLQIRHKSAAGVDCLTRIVWAPSKAGILEFTLTTDTQTARLARQTMDVVLITFQSNEKGKLEIIPRSEQT